MRVHLAAAIAALGPLLGLSPPAAADDAVERRIGGRVVAREARPHRLRHEFNLGVGILPLDALYTGISFGGSYSFHLSDAIALELVDFRYSANLDSGLRSNLAERYEVSPTVTPEVEYIAGTGIVLTPLFGKLAVLDESVVYAATHLGLNVGVAHFSDGFRFQGSVGPGVRLFMSDAVSSRLDVRGTFALDGDLSVESLLQVNLSVAFNFGTQPSDGSSASTSDERVDPEAELNALFPDTEPEPRTDGGPNDDEVGL